MRVLGYARVSSGEQATNGVSLEAQREAIEAECSRRGWELVDFIEDAGASGKNLKRPGIGRLLAALEGHQADVLMVAKLDRLSRSLLDFAALMDLSERQKWQIVILDFGVDTTTPAGEAMVHMLATFAQFERRMIGQRTKEALAIKKAQGVVLGRRRALPDEVVERIRRERAKKKSYQAIADGLNADGIPTAQGGRQWWHSTVRKVLER